MRVLTATIRIGDEDFLFLAPDALTAPLPAVRRRSTGPSFAAAATPFDVPVPHVSGGN